MKRLSLAIIFILLSILAYGQNDEIVYYKMKPSDTIELGKAWKVFVKAIESRDAEKIKQLSLQEIDCILCIDINDTTRVYGDYLIPVDTFINQAFNQLIGSPLWKAINERGYRASQAVLGNYRPKNLPQQKGKDLEFYEIWIRTYRPNEWAEGHEGQSHGFQFVKINGEFRFFGLTSVP